MKKAIAMLLMLMLSLSTFACIQTTVQPARTDTRTDAAETPASEQPTGMWLMTKDTQYSVDGTVITTHVYTYEFDANGRETRVGETFTYNERIRSTEAQIEYDESGRPVRLTVYMPDETVMEVESIFDQDGNWVGLTYQNPWGNIARAEYNADGKLTQTIIFLEDGTAERKLYSYDEHGQLIRYCGYNKNGELSDGYEYEYTYDAEGRIEKSRKTDLRYGGTEVLEYEFDAEGRQIKETRFYESEYLSGLQGWTVFEYDDNGNRIRSSYYNDSGEMEQYEIYEWTYEPNAIYFPPFGQP